MLIVVEGSIGAGKSTVAEGLAGYRKSELCLESFESNPFLPAFYENPTAYGLETEFAFLLIHYHQLKKQTNSTPNGEWIADFHLGKDLLYANLNLGDSKTLNAFRELYSLLYEEVPKPNLMICLSGSTELVIERIRRRKRDFELKIDPTYYAGVNAAYEEFFDEYDGLKIKIPMDEWDFIKNPDLYRDLSALIDEQLKSR